MRFGDLSWFGLLGIVSIGIAACTATDFCNQQFTRDAEVRACLAGAELGKATDDENELAQQCQDRYSIGNVDPNMGSDYFGGANEMADLFVACRAGGVAQIRIRASYPPPQDGGVPAAGVGCEQVTVGGTTRCE